MGIVPPPQTGGRSESKSGISGAKPLKKREFQPNLTVDIPHASGDIFGY
jgi:hypothetical protein